MKMEVSSHVMLHMVMAIYYVLHLKSIDRMIFFQNGVLQELWKPQ